jgi:hypothetical protein
MLVNTGSISLRIISKIEFFLASRAETAGFITNAILELK